MAKFFKDHQFYEDVLEFEETKKSSKVKCKFNEDITKNESAKSKKPHKSRREKSEWIIWEEED